MNNEKKKSKGLKSLLGQRKFRYGGYATILTVVVIAVVILLNVALGAVETNWALSLDVTAINATDFEDATYEILEGVDQDIHVYTLYQSSTSSSLRVQVESVLEKYHALNSHITVENIDPVAEPTRVTKYAGDTSLSEGAVIVTNGDESRIKLINRSDYYYYTTSSYTGSSYTYFTLESKMTSALVYVTSAETPRVFYLSGHNELDADSYCTLLTAQLQNRNYDVSKLDLSNSDVELTSGDTVIIIDPERDLNDDEYATLRAWLSDGGRMLCSMTYDVDLSRLPNFVKLLDYYQLSYGDGIITEDESATGNYWNNSVLNIVPVMDSEHDITSDLADGSSYLVVPSARPINAVEIPESGVSYTKLLTSSAKATAVNGDESSLPGTQTLALAMLKQDSSDSSKDTRIVLMDSLYLLADTNLMYYSYNLNFTLNTIDWLVNSDSTVLISSKYIADSVLSIPDSTTAWSLAAIVVIIIPLIVAVFGAVVWIKRRRL